LSPITQICSNPTCREKKIFYPLPYSFIITNDYPRQNKGLEKRIGLWIEHYVNENGLLLNYQSFQLWFSWYIYIRLNTISI